MQVDKNNSWKEKIGPAFGDLIKAYLDYIKPTHICSIDKHWRFILRSIQSLVYTFNIRSVNPNIKGVICVMMERRDYLDRVKNTIFRSPIVALLGSRQCSKTISARRMKNLS
jgi:hypothetical protein